MMDADEAIELIQWCVERDQVDLDPHFLERLDERSVYWVDVLRILSEPTRVIIDGVDDAGRTRCLVEGWAINVPRRIKFLAVIDQTDGHSPFTIFITVYWMR